MSRKPFSGTSVEHLRAGKRFLKIAKASLGKAQWTCDDLFNATAYLAKAEESFIDAKDNVSLTEVINLHDGLFSEAYRHCNMKKPFTPRKSSKLSGVARRASKRRSKLRRPRSAASKKRR